MIYVEDVTRTLNNDLINFEVFTYTSKVTSIIWQHHSFDSIIQKYLYRENKVVRYESTGQLFGPVLILQTMSLKLVSAMYYQIFIFDQMIALQKLWKMFFISSKKLFLFLRYSNFCIFVYPSFSSCQPLR